MFRVTVDGEARIWQTLEYAMYDVFSRGYQQDFILEKSIEGFES